MDLKRWAAEDAPKSGPRPTLTPDERTALKVLAGPKMSDAKRAQAMGFDIEKARQVSWSLREKLAPVGNETLKQAAKRHGLI